MEMTMFLASLWGPALLVLGIGFFTSPNFYTKIYRDVEKASLSMLIFGIGGMMGAIAQISFHNTWDTLPEIIISLLGWGTLLKAAVYTIKPDIADKGGDWVVASKLVPGAGVLLLVIGGYLSWFAYF